MAQVLVIYEQPADKAKFDRHYFSTHVPLAKQIPGLQRYEVSRGPITGDPGAESFHLVATLSFPSMKVLQAALDSPQCKAATDDLKNFADGVRILVFDNEAI